VKNKDFIPSKRCSKCKEEKPLSSFYSNKTTSDGLQRECKKCCSERHKEWNKKNKHKKARHQIKYKYGITYEEYELYLDKQSYKCAICSIHQDELSKKLNIDHNHETGEVRGLLCSNCNTALGLLKDNVDLFNKAIEYLEINKPYKLSST